MLIAKHVGGSGRDMLQRWFATYLTTPLQLHKLQTDTDARWEDISE